VRPRGGSDKLRALARAVLDAPYHGGATAARGTRREFRPAPFVLRYGPRERSSPAS